MGWCGIARRMVRRVVRKEGSLKSKAPTLGEDKSIMMGVAKTSVKARLAGRLARRPMVFAMGIGYAQLWAHCKAHPKCMYLQQIVHLSPRCNREIDPW